MSTSLSSHADNLAEIYRKECKGCMEKTKITSECNFIGLKNNKLNYKCKKIYKKIVKTVDRLIEKFLSLY